VPKSKILDMMNWGLIPDGVEKLGRPVEDGSEIVLEIEFHVDTHEAFEEFISPRLGKFMVETFNLIFRTLQNLFFSSGKMNLQLSQIQRIAILGWTRMEGVLCNQRKRI